VGEPRQLRWEGACCGRAGADQRRLGLEFGPGRAHGLIAGVGSGPARDGRGLTLPRFTPASHKSPDPVSNELALVMPDTRDGSSDCSGAERTATTRVRGRGLLYTFPGGCRCRNGASPRPERAGRPGGRLAHRAVTVPGSKAGLRTISLVLRW
jgi:hypothetical protein